MIHRVDYFWKMMILINQFLTIFQAGFQLRTKVWDEFQNGPRISAVNKKWNPVLGSLNISNTKISDSGAYKCTTYTAKENGFKNIFLAQPIREKYSSIILKLRFLNLIKGMLETKYKVEILKKMSLDLQIEKPEVEPNGIFIFNIIIT